MNAFRKRLRRLNSRRGIVLLMVVSLLTLFVLIGITYAVVASMYRDTAKNQAGRLLVGDPPEREIENVMYVLLRDSLTKSPFQYHSLLYDLYGDDGSKEVLAANAIEENGPTVSGNIAGQVWRLQLDNATARGNIQQPYGRTLSDVDDYYVGQTITFTTGNARGISAAVLRYISNQKYLYVEAPTSDLSSKIPLPLAGDTLIMNGKPFNGMGFGYDNTTYNVDAKVSGEYLALLPNFAAHTSVPPLYQLGGADESWDAADFQNMFLSYIPADRSTKLLIPSFHRPDLIKFFEAKYSGSIPPAIRRMIQMRPSNVDHPNFTGGNPYFDPTSLNGPYDVDNDGDGVADSVWIDPGLPVMTAKDGRRYKRLVAVLIKDLDGRINLNAHGNLRLMQSYDDTTLAATPFPSGAAGAFAGVPNGTATLKLPHGLGFGPAEVLFRHVLQDDNEYRNLLYARYGNDGRPGSQNDFFWMLKHYGISRDLYSPPSNAARPSSGSQTTLAGTVGGPVATTGMSPVDPWGRGVVGLDSSGQPMQFGAGRNDEVESAAGSGVWDMPYMSCAGAAPQRDETPFTAADLESILRFADPDARMVSDRIRNAAPSLYNDSTATGHRKRDLLTTTASHIPTPRVNIPNELRTTAPFNGGTTSAATAPSVIDLYRARMGTYYTQAGLNRILAWELRQGRRFNLNRYLGNGLDDDGDGIIDEADEIANEYAWTETARTYPGNYYQKTPYIVNEVDVNEPDPANASGIHDPTLASGSRNQQADRLLAKQLYCRHLYCLMWAVFNGGFTPTHSNPLDDASANQSDLYAQRIAQWVVNVVDFRDSDSIMTGFEYDKDPSRGWRVDGDLSTNEGSHRGFAWGMEAPDLLMTELTAFHATRLRDTDNDDDKHKKIGPDTNVDDDDVDQYRIPQGSLYLELYCPKTRMTGPGSTGRMFQYPSELYSYNTGNNKLQLDLDRAVSQTSGMTTVTSPVWQVIISQQHAADNPSSGQYLATHRPLSANFDPANPTQLTSGAPPALTVDRRILFTKGVPSDALQDRTFYNMGRSGWPDAKLTPGQYAVIGPREKTVMGSIDASATTTPATPKWGGDSKQSIVMTTNAGVTYADQTGAQTQRNAFCMIAEMPPPVSWVTNTTDRWRQGLNISEPLASGATYYKEPASGLLMGPDDAYCDIDTGGQTLPDTPFESVKGRAIYPSYPLNDAIYTKPGEAKTYENVRTIYLQRLADPTKIFNADTNPYITVDWATSDLTVFGGEANETSTGTFFNSRERGYTKNPTPARNSNLWFPVTVQNKNPTAGAGAGGDFFKHQLNVVANPTVGSLNYALDDPDSNGQPVNSPFPWPAWNDRPFANPAELLMVPWSSASRFGFEMDRLPAANTNANTNHFDTTPNQFFMFGRNAAPGNEPGAYGFLANFHSSSKLGSGGTTSADLYRLFDFVETPSPYSGTERWFNPDTSNGHFGDGDPAAGATGPLYRPPFNNRSLLREPGRININTFNDWQVWEAVAKQMPFMDPTVTDLSAAKKFVKKVMESRQGFDGGSDTYHPYLTDSLDPTKVISNPNFPTIFANPFRSANSADLMPDVPTGPTSMRQQTPINATMLRADRDNPSNPLFSFQSQATGINQPMIGDISRQKFNNTDRNAYFKHQPLAKVANMLTTNSNCYAMWITVGYFEVEDVPTTTSSPTVDYTVYPDGLRLAGEISTSEGVQRHRGFYLIDRSIPVAFEPGENHNVDRCILLRRMIE